MSSDYTLPPVPHNPHTALERDWTQTERKAISAYGHACRAPLAEENARLLARIAELERINQGLNRDCMEHLKAAIAVEEERDRIRAELETERMRLAACGVIAMANTADSAAQQRKMLPEYWSGSAESVAAAVDREMALRAEVEALKSALTECADDLEAEVNARASGELPHRIERDLEPVRKARALLAQPAGPWVNPLAAEVEKLRAESVIEWEPGRSYTAAELLRRAIRGVRVRKGRSICPAVENLFGCGNTVARYLCRWAGRDPDTGKAIAARKGEGE